MATSRTILKTYFETGDIPTEAQFADLIDSMFSLDDDYLEKQLACSDLTTSLTTGTNKGYFRMPYAATLVEVRASVLTAPTGASIIVDINKNSSSILSTKLSIDAGEKTSTTAAIPSVISDTSLSDDSEITIDIDQVGSTIGGAGLIVTLIYKKI